MAEEPRESGALRIYYEIPMNYKYIDVISKNNYKASKYTFPKKFENFVKKA